MNKENLKRSGVIAGAAAGTLAPILSVHAAADPALVNAFTDVTTKTTDNVTALLPVIGVLFALMVGISVAIYLVKRFRKG